MIEVKAKLMNVKISPKKMRLVANAIRGLDAPVAVLRLQHFNQKSAPLILKTLKSAIANAEHNKELASGDLFIKKIIVNEGVALKRWKPAAMGSAHAFKKQFSHLEIVLSLKKGVAEPKIKAVKKEDKPQIETVTKDQATGESKIMKKDNKAGRQDLRRAAKPYNQAANVNKGGQSRPAVRGDK